MELKFFWQLTLRGQRFFLLYTAKKCLKNAVLPIVILITISIERCHTYAYFGKIFSTGEANSSVMAHLCTVDPGLAASPAAVFTHAGDHSYFSATSIHRHSTNWYTDGTNSVKVVVISYDPLFNLYIDIFKNFFHSQAAFIPRLHAIFPNFRMSAF